MEREEQMFLGQFSHTFDDKSRLTVPAKFREPLADGAYVVQGLDNNLMVLTASAFEIIYNRLMAMNMTDPSARALRRIILGNASPANLDSAGRILIPQALRDLVGLQTEAVLVGQGDYFEIWSPVNWQVEEAKLQDPTTNDQRFATLDLSTR